MQIIFCTLNMSLPKTLPMKSARGDVQVPSVGFGTFAAGDTSWCYDATLSALKAGYRHLDCAWSYGVCVSEILPSSSPALSRPSS